MGFSEFPAQWEWVALILGGVAFIMAVQPFIQFCFGRPRLRVLFDTHETDDGRILHCALYSPQVSKVLRKIGIRRDAIQGLNVSASVVDLRTNKTIKHEDFVALVDPEANELNVVDIASPEAMVMVWVAMMRKGEGKALTALRMCKGQIQLPPGEYICHLCIKSASVDEELSRKFIVGKEPHELYWEQINS